MYIVDRKQVEGVLFYGGHYIEDFGNCKIEVSKSGYKLKISGINKNTNLAFNLPNITGIETYEEVQEVINNNMRFIEDDAVMKNYNHLIAYRLRRLPN